MAKLGYPARRALIIRRAVGWGDANLLRPFLAEKDLKKGLFIYRNHHKKALLRGSRLFPAVPKLLSYLKRKGYKLAVASNRPTKFSLILIRHLKIGKFFDYYLFADKLKRGKPHPEILIKIRKRFSLGPSEVLYVGDMAIDVQAGRRARIKTVAVTTGSNTRQELKKEIPYLIISGITDLQKIL